MAERAIDFIKALFILIIGIVIIGALIQDSFGVSESAKKIFYGIGGIGVIVIANSVFLIKTLYRG